MFYVKVSTLCGVTCTQICGMVSTCTSIIHIILGLLVLVHVRGVWIRQLAPAVVEVVPGSLTDQVIAWATAHWKHKQQTVAITHEAIFKQRRKKKKLLTLISTTTKYILWK